MNLTKIVSLLFIIFCSLALILHPEMGEKRDWALYYACFLSILISYGIVIFWRIKKSVIPAQENISFFRFSKWDSFAFIFFALNSMRPYDLCMNFFHHHSYYVGPAELLCQGFIPLREIPSQYGFLTYVLTEIMPFGSAWNNFLVLNRVFVFVFAIFLYFFMRLLFPRPQEIPLFMGLTFLSVFVLPGIPFELTGPLTYPSVSGFRFLPSFLLIFIALIITRFDVLNPAAFGTVKVLIFTGFFLWGLSLLWSVESFLYATGAWASFQFSWVILKGLRQKFSWQNIFKNHLKCLASFFFCGVLMWGGGVFIYILKYGIYPDIVSVWEYAQVYQSGFGSIPITPRGPSWIFLLLFITGTVLGAFLLEKNNTLFPLVTATLGWMFVCSSYYISRSHFYNFTNLMPQVVVSLSVFYLAVQELSAPNYKRLVFISRVLGLGVAVLILTLPLIKINTRNRLVRLVKDWGTPQMLPAATNVPSTNELKQFERKLEHALNELKIGRQEPWVLMDRVLETSPISSLQLKRWLPFSPYEAFAILPLERQIIYVERVAKRNRTGGWLVYQIHQEHLFKELSEVLFRNFKKVKERSFQNWRAVYFQFIDCSTY